MRQTQDHFLERKGMFLLEVTHASGSPGFYLIPGNAGADLRPILNQRHMKGRVIAFNGDPQFRGNNIRRIEDPMLYESELRTQGFKMVDYPASEELKIVPAERPKLELDLKQASQLLAICAAPALHYNEKLNKSGKDLIELSESQVDEVLRSFGYIATPEMLTKIMNGPIPAVPDDPSKPLNDTARDFVMQIASMPQNLKSGLVSNAELIDLYEKYQANSPGLKLSSRPDAPSPSLKPSPNRLRF